MAEHHAPGEHLLRGPLQEAGGPDHSDPGHHCGLDVHCGGLGVAPGALGLRVWAGGGFGRVAGLGGGVGGSPRNSEPHFVERSTVGLGCWVWYWLGLRAVRVGSRECPLSSTAVVPLADLRGPGLRFALLPHRVAGAVPARLEHDRLFAGADAGRLGRPAGRATKLRQYGSRPQISLTNSEYALTKTLEAALSLGALCVGMIVPDLVMLKGRGFFFLRRNIQRGFAMGYWWNVAS